MVGGRTQPGLLVASVAVGGGRGVLAVRVALRASHRSVRAGEREGSQIMIEHRVLPAGRTVAGLALHGEIRLAMIRVGGRVVIVEMATGAVRRRSSEPACGMTSRACDTDVSAGQGKRRRRMIEFRVQPGDRGVAHTAILRKTGGDVVRIARAGVILHVAAIAIGRSSGESSAEVARRAIDGGMGSK